MDLKMSLRMWSDTQDLDSVIQDLGGSPTYAYKKGELVHIGRQKRPYVPKRHSASFPEVEVHDFGGIASWLVSRFDLLEGSELTASLIRNGIVDAVLWIAVFNEMRIDVPPVRPEFVERARSSGIRILIENYSSDPYPEGEPTGPDDEVRSSRPKIPTKTWYPEE